MSIDPVVRPVTAITGGSSGIGAAAARQLLAHGHCVTVTGRHADRLERLANELGRPAELLTIVADAADPDAMSTVIEQTVDTFGRLDNAVANAGVASHDGLADGDPALWREMVLTNVLGPALLVRFALPHLRQTRGRIVCSVAGHVRQQWHAIGRECPSCLKRKPASGLRGSAR
jgi:NADP-dependent 3-hydroxy acid dehydrogenase YdfG